MASTLSTSVSKAVADSSHFQEISSPGTLASLPPVSSQLGPVRAAIRLILPQPGYDDGSFGPLMVRLAWHSAGTYCALTDTGGSNGAGMSFELEADDPDNAGLQIARDALNEMKVKYGFEWISHADLYTLAGAESIEALGGPKIRWGGGRTDYTTPIQAVNSGVVRGRLPDASQGANYLRHVFSRMGFDDREIVALAGAHCLGRCHSDRSGYEGKWVNNPVRFSNAFFRILVGNEWKRKTLSNGLEQYSFQDDDSGLEDERIEGLMMLPSDMALLEDPKFSVWVQRYAEDGELFFMDFVEVFAKLLELGLHRDGDGRVLSKGNLVVPGAGCPFRARL